MSARLTAASEPGYFLSLMHSRLHTSDISATRVAGSGVFAGAIRFFAYRFRSSATG